jgi:hypothetical protein
MSQGEPAFSEFYAAYLEHHRQPLNRALHLLAKLLALASLAAAVVERSPLLLLAAPVLAVAPCWLGHLWFEGNRPVSWEQPAASLLGTLAGALRRLAPRRAGAARPGQPPAGRAYFSLLADLRMCGEMLVSRPPAAGSHPAAEPPDTSQPT